MKSLKFNNFVEGIEFFAWIKQLERVLKKLEQNFEDIDLRTNHPTIFKKNIDYFQEEKGHILWKLREILCEFGEEGQGQSSRKESRKES